MFQGFLVSKWTGAYITLSFTHICAFLYNIHTPVNTSECNSGFSVLYKDTLAWQGLNHQPSN